MKEGGFKGSKLLKGFLTVIIDPLTVPFLAGMLAYYNNEKESKF